MNIYCNLIICFDFFWKVTHADTSYKKIQIDGNKVEHWRHTEGDLAVMKCVTNLNDYPVIVWTKDGRVRDRIQLIKKHNKLHNPFSNSFFQPVPRGMRILEIVNRGNSFLEVPRMSLRDEGNYTCAVSHEFGYAKKMFRVCIISKLILCFNPFSHSSRHVQNNLFFFCFLEPGVKEDCPRWWYNWNY